MKIQRMRRMHLTIIGLLLGYSLMSASLNTDLFTPNRTDVTIFNPNLTLGSNLNNLFAQGVWVETLAVGEGKTQVQSLLQFNSTREVTLLIRDAGIYFSYYHLSWKIEQIDQQEQLILTDGPEGFERIYWLKENGAGIDLMEFRQGRPVIMEYRAHMPQRNMKTLQEALMGLWENRYFPLELVASNYQNLASKDQNGALYYEFNEDGTYEKFWRGEKQTAKEAGSWEISSDGNHLILHPKFQDSYATQIIRIKFIELDEMVLEHEFPADNASGVVRLKDFYFNKQ